MTHDVDRVAARIVRSSSGGPIRTIITGRKRIPTGRFCSAKNARSMPWEGHAERDHLIVCEADTDVVSYLSQPFRLEILDEADVRPVVYLPDMEQRLADGATRIVEVKDAKARKPRPDYEQKLADAERVFAALGWGFEVVDASEIRREPRFSNSRALVPDASATVPPDRLVALVSAMEARRSMSLGEVSGILGPDPVGRARANALVVRRVLWMDLDERIDVRSRVSREVRR